MFVKQDYYIGYNSIGKGYYITNKALLNFMEDTGGIHSSIAGTGVLDIERTHLSWIALHWIVKVHNRPRYGDIIKVKTWTIDKENQKEGRLYADRDFEVFDKEGNIIVTATSRWLMIDTLNSKIAKLTDEIKIPYQEEKRRVWENIEYKKLLEPEHIDLVQEYVVDKRMIDFNNHVHNTNYMDFVDMVVDDSIGQMSNDFEIMYKKETKLNDKVKIKYSHLGDGHTVVVKSEDDKNLHAIIKLS